MFFDGAKNKSGVEAGVYIVNRPDEMGSMLFTFKLDFEANIVEYKALVLGISTTWNLGACELRIYDDSQSVPPPMDQSPIDECSSPPSSSPSSGPSPPWFHDIMEYLTSGRVLKHALRSIIWFLGWICVHLLYFNRWHPGL